ncbi:MAG: methyltransferase cognate corrinoid protein [Bacillota bacterium]|nr:methyltransferase cognate corrinoid protein [Bacillota bacterium]
MSKDAIIKEAIEAMIKCNEDIAVDVMKRAIAEGLDPVEILSDGFSAGIREVGDLFGRGQVFLPELMLSADVMKTISGMVDEEMAKTGKTAEKKGTMILATVEGDVHDIGKGIVASIIKTQGIEIIDLGRDVPVPTIIAKAEEYNADLIGTSALLTTTLAEQKKLEEVLKDKGLKSKYKTMVGGAPATQRWADRIGADAYAEDAAEAVNKALALLQS